MQFDCSKSRTLKRADDGDFYQAAENATLHDQAGLRTANVGSFKYGGKFWKVQSTSGAGIVVCPQQTT